MNYKVNHWILLFSLLFAAPGVFGQKESLLIGPGDDIKVQVFDTPELSQEVRVSDAGTIPLFLLGPVHVAGLTPEGAARVIEKALVDGKYMLAPHVDVVLAQTLTQNVSVLGQVKQAGEYPIATPRKLTDVLSLAGGISEVASRHITIQRHDTGEKVQVFLANNADQVFSNDPLVYPGDSIFVPRADIVYVMGDVSHPGGYAATTDDAHITVLRAIALAGGTPPHAVPSKARLIRRKPDGSYVTTSLQISLMQKGKKEDMVLQANDIIYVPFSYLRNAAVNLSSILAAAGGAAIYAF